MVRVDWYDGKLKKLDELTKKLTGPQFRCCCKKCFSKANSRSSRQLVFSFDLRFSQGMLKELDYDHRILCGYSAKRRDGGKTDEMETVNRCIKFI